MTGGSVEIGCLRRRPKPEAIILRIESYPQGLVDLRVTLLRGGTFSIGLAAGEDDGSPFRLGLPNGMEDQQHWVCGPGGFVPGPKVEET